jgi:omega-6 fatty acid desaturase (delta-12 desaturase)
LRRSLWQIVNSLGAHLLMWYLMYRSLEIGYWLTLLLALPTAGFLVRVFIILHDCGHGSFFKTAKGNDFWGVICGIFTFTPYFQWRHAHAIHHASSGDLDRRGIGDVLTLTIEEYMHMPWWKRVGYRIYRHPLFLFTLAPAYVFLIGHRFTAEYATQRDRLNVHFTNLAMLAIFMVLGWAIGFGAVLMVELPIILLSATAGVWLFYIQHQFEDTYWREHPEWQYADAALIGSSYYKLPRWLQWFTGNIGFHHIHHLSPKIPNYKLEKCHNENPIFQIQPLTIRDSLKSLYFRLWDEKEKMLVGWRAIRKYRMKMRMGEM